MLIYRNRNWDWTHVNIITVTVSIYFCHRFENNANKRRCSETTSEYATWAWVLKYTNKYITHTHTIVINRNSYFRTFAIRYLYFYLKSPLNIWVAFARPSKHRTRRVFNTTYESNSESHATTTIDFSTLKWHSMLRMAYSVFALRLYYCRLHIELCVWIFFFRRMTARRNICSINNLDLLPSTIEMHLGLKCAQIHTLSPFVFNIIITWMYVDFFVMLLFYLFVVGFSLCNQSLCGSNFVWLLAIQRLARITKASHQLCINHDFSWCICIFRNWILVVVDEQLWIAIGKFNSRHQSLVKIKLKLSSYEILSHGNCLFAVQWTELWNAIWSHLKWKSYAKLRWRMFLNYLQFNLKMGKENNFIISSLW